jgi:solute carrier family 25 (peroxisomal adenine nucleotide transporter), member 17
VSTENGFCNGNKNMVEYGTDLYRREGASVFFRGMEIAALQSAIEKACYFFAYSALKRLYFAMLTTTTRTGARPAHGGDDPSPSISPFVNLALGCLAEWVHLPVTLPIDALTTAVQTSSRCGGSESPRTNQDAMTLLVTLCREGSVYKGIQAYYILCLKPAIQYTIFEQVKARILVARRRRGSSQPQRFSAMEAFALGVFSRMVATLAVFPFARAKVRMQSRSSKGGGNGGMNCSSSSSLTVWQLLKTSYATGGVASLYHGLGPELTRGVLSAALMMMVKERISGGVKRVLYREQRQG